MNAPNGPVSIFSDGNLTLTARCIAGDDVEVIASTSVNDSSIRSSHGTDNAAADFDIGEQYDIMSTADNDVIGQLVYRSGPANGPTVTMTWYSDENSINFDCNVFAHAIVSTT